MTQEFIGTITVNLSKTLEYRKDIIHLRRRDDQTSLCGITNEDIPSGCLDLFPIEYLLDEHEVWCKDCVDALSPVEQLSLVEL